MSPAEAVALLAVTGFGFAAPWVAGRLGGRADPRLIAGVALLALVDLALLPLVWLACLAGGALPGLAHECWQALASIPGPDVAAGVTLALVAALTWHTGAAVLQSREATPRGWARAACRPLALPGGGRASLVPVAEPLAYVTGLARPRVVVSEGLLGLLSPQEQQAVLAHEAAHLHLGHARVLLFGSAIAHAYKWMPGIARAWTLLRRELEAAADDEAARAVDAPTLVRALARVAIARSRPAAAAFNDLDPATLRYRIHRLQQPARPAPGAGAMARVYGLVLAGALTWSACALAGARLTVAGFLICALATAWLAMLPAGGVVNLRRRAQRNSGTPAG